MMRLLVLQFSIHLKSDLIMEILLFYYIFSVLFMVGYVNTNSMKAWQIVVVSLLMLIIAPIVVPINIGYYIYQNS